MDPIRAARRYLSLEASGDLASAVAFARDFEDAASEDAMDRYLDAIERYYESYSEEVVLEVK